MANIKVKNADGTDQFLKATGAGTDPDPFVPEQVVSVPGGATAANQATEIARLDTLITQTDTLEALLANVATQATLAAVQALLGGGLPPALVAGRLSVDGSGVTQPVSGPLTDAQLRATAVPVSTSALPLPTGAATEATLSAANAKLPPLLATVPDNEVSAPPSRQVGQDIWAASFSAVGSGLLDTQFATPHVDAGVTVSQASGALNIAAGVNANDEFLARSVRSWRGSWVMRASVVLSQRIANNNFGVLMADLFAEDVPLTVNSATSVTVTVTGHTLTSANVGQSMNLGSLSLAGAIPGRYAIASVVPGVSITFTVAGWPASGSDTVTLFGYNYYRVLYSGTTATNTLFDAQRRGWASGDSTLTINSTAAPGHIIQVESAGRSSFVYDATRASSSTPSFSSRGSRIENLPDDNLDLYLWLWSFNGSTAPASSTTWTISFCSVEKFANTPVYIQGQRATGLVNPMPIAFSATGAVQGGAAHDAAISGSPVRIGGRAVTTNYTAVAAGDVADLISTLVGALVVQPYATPDNSWSASLSLTTTTAQAIQLAAPAGLKRHPTAMQVSNTGSAVEVFILDGVTERWRHTIPAGFFGDVSFPTSLQLTAATALNVNLSAAGTVRVTVQGYTAP